MADHGPAVGVAVALVLVLICVPFTTARVSEARASWPAASQAVTILNQLTGAVAAAGGHHRVLPCKSSFVAINHSVQTALAWKLHTTLERVGTSMRAPGVDFIGPHNAADGGPAAVDPRLTHEQTIGHFGVWRIVALTDPRLPTRPASVTKGSPAAASSRSAASQESPDAGGVRAPAQNVSRMLVLGIDPGTASTGYGLVRSAGSRLHALELGVIATRAGVPQERRLADIHARVGELLDGYEPDAMAIEELYFGANVRTAFAVGQARGVVLLAAGQRGVPARSYTPQQVKAAVCGHGRADKAQVGRMVARLVGMAAPPPLTMPRMRWRWPSATSTARRCSAPCGRRPGWGAR